MATQHVDAILSNPLLAVRPRRRASDATALDIMRDPMGWFLNEIAMGAATLPKAEICLEMLDHGMQGTSGPPRGNTPASVIVEWLRTSQLDASKEFVERIVTKEGRPSKFAARLLQLVASEGQMDAFWRWFTRPSAQRMKETGLNYHSVILFKGQLLSAMVNAQTSANGNVADGLHTFMKALQATESSTETKLSHFGPAGARLVNTMTDSSEISVTPELYTSFLRSSRQLFGAWGVAVESMLWLHHPTQPKATPGLQFIQDPSGAMTHVTSGRARRKFLVRLCLGVAHQLMEQQDYRGAQVAMQFTKDHLADLVMAPTSTTSQERIEQNKRDERLNLELLDGLVPA